MLDIKALRANPEETEATLQRRNPTFTVQEVIQLDEDRRTLLQEEETLRNERNALNKELGLLRKNGENADHIIEATRGISEAVKRIELEKDRIAEEQNNLLLNLPNLPHDTVPSGASEDDNVEVRRWGCEFKQRPMQGVPPHWETGVALNWLTVTSYS